MDSTNTGKVLVKGDGSNVVSSGVFKDNNGE